MSQLYVTGVAKIRNLTGALTASSGIVDVIGIGTANGLATLDSSSKLTISQLPNSVMELKGDWDASTNTPTLANGVGNIGDMYRCSVPGTVDFGAGGIYFYTGDLVLYTGSIWQKNSASINLTTIGNSGAATFAANILNVPNYTISGLGGVPNSRLLSINGTQYDLTTDRAWNIPSNPQARNEYNFTATDSQTTFTTSGYVVNQVDVFYNGSKLLPSDFTATNGTSVILGFSCLVGDTVTVLAYVNNLAIGGGGTSGALTKWVGSSTLGNAVAGTDYQAPGNYITALTGDITASGPGSVAATLATVNTNTGTFGSSTAIPVITVNGKGLITALTTTAVSIPSGSLSFIGDVTGTGTTGSNTTLTLATVNTNVYASNTFLKLAVNGKGLNTSATPVISSDITGVLGYTPEDVANKATSTSLGTSNTLYPTQNAVKTYVDSATAGGIILQGDWNASTNSPNISFTTVTGWAWRVSVAGSTNIGGITDWQIGDLVVKTATGWLKIDNTDSITSVFGRYGAITASSGDYNTSQVTENTNLYFTTARAQGAISLTTTGSSGAATYISGVLNIPNYGNALSSYVPYTGATTNVNLGSNNIYANAFFGGFLNITASGTQVVLTVLSAPEILVSGSGGQTIKLPDATTLPNGTTYSFNNNQTTGAITVNNNSNTLIVSIPSGGYAEVILLDNLTAAGSWDRHFQAPANVSWSTNTFDYAGSITSATWNGNVVAINRGGTGSSTQNFVDLTTTQTIGGAKTFSSSLTASSLIKTGGTSSQFLKADGSVDSSSYITLASLSATSPIFYNNTTGVISSQAATSSVNGYLTSTDWTTFNNKQAALSGTGFVKISGTTISYDNSSYYLASNPSSFITLSSLSAGTGISYNNTTGVITSTITQYTDALARASISLTTTGSSGASTYSSTTGILNIPTYTLSGLGGVPTSRTLTINGTSYDLSADRSWTITSMIYPSAGIAVSTGTAWGTSITDNSANWNTAYTNRITSLTVTGSSGAATLVSNVLNIPTYTLSGLGGQPLATNLTSVAGLTYVSASFVKMTAAGTFALDTNTYLTTTTASSTYQPIITLTTTGSSGASTFTSNTLNVPTYTLTGLGGVPTSRSLTINGTAYDLSADRSWTIPTSVNATFTQDYTATAAQTTFTVTGGYTVGQLAVFYNGSKLASNEYTASNGTTFVLATACQVNDIVQAVVSITGGGIGGSGTTNYVSKFTASGVLGNSLIWDNGTNVGIGNTNTSYTLDVTGTINATKTLTLRGQTDPTSGVGMELFYRTADTSSYLQSYDRTNSAWKDVKIYGNTLYFGSQGSNNLTINTSGNVGIGTTPSSWNSAYKTLQIGASMSFLQDGTSVSSYWGGNLYVGTDGNYKYTLTGTAGLFGLEGNSLVLYNAPSGTAGTTASITERFRITSGGNVGIGTSSPTKKLHISAAVAGVFEGLLVENTSSSSYSLYQCKTGSSGVWQWGVWTDNGYRIGVSGVGDYFSITSGGNVLIGRTATGGQSAKLQIETSATDGIYVKQNSSGGYTYVSIAANNGGTYYYMVFTAGTTDTGSITSNGTTTTYSVTSDYRLKEDFKDINGLEKLLAIKVYDFKFKNSENRMDGVIAHELQEIIPYAVVGEKDGEKMQGVDYSLIVPTLVKAMQEMNTKLDEQNQTIQSLQEQINILAK